MIRTVPGIYQNLILKQYEYRVTCIGKYQSWLKIESQATDASTVDWRASQFAGVPTYIVDPPEHLKEFCYKYMNELKLVFCIFDLVIDTEGDAVFLEINQAGQFLFIEEMAAETRLLAAFAEFLENPHEDFMPTFAGNTTTFAEILENPEIQERYTADQSRVPTGPNWIKKRRMALAEG